MQPLTKTYTEKTSFIDLHTPKELLKPSLIEAFENVLTHGQFIMGPEVFKLEDELAQYTGVEHSITCANGTDAITLALMALDIQPDDIVMVPAFSYVATAEAVAQLGGTPFFIDVAENSFNVDSESLFDGLKCLRRKGQNPAAVIIVDLFGCPADISEFANFAKEQNIKIIRDSAQSFGAQINNRSVLSYADISTTSFFPAKPLGCFGDGGAVFTNECQIAEKVRSLRLHGAATHKYSHKYVGINSRLDTIQAAILLQKLKLFPQELLARNHLANQYSNVLADYFTVPYIPEGTTSTWAQYTLRHIHRNEILKHMSDVNIPCNIYYPKPIPLQQAYNTYPIVNTGIGNATNLSNTVFSIPMHGYMHCDNEQRIVDALICVGSKKLDKNKK